MYTACRRYDLPTLQVRELPGELYAQLRAKAREEHRSIAQQTIVLLREALGVPGSRKNERKAILQRIGERSLGPSHNLPDSATLIREDREK